MKVWTDFTGISTESGATETVIAGTVMAAVPEAALVRDVAVMVAVISLTGALAGALYVAEVLLRFVSVPAPDDGEIDQLTPVCAGSYCTLAVSTCVVPAGTVAVLGETVTTLAGTVTTTAPDVDALATAVAVMVTARSLGGGPAGAL